MKNQYRYLFFVVFLLLEGCCSVDYVNHLPQHVVIKNYGGFALTAINNAGKQAITFNNDVSKTSTKTVIDKNDTLCVIEPYAEGPDRLFKSDIKVLIINKILNRVDTLQAKFSMQKIDSCNEYPKITEVIFNGKKGVVRNMVDSYGDYWEVPLR